MYPIEPSIRPTFQPQTPDRLTYTIKEAARALGVSRGLAYEMAREGRLPTLRLGQRRILVPRGALDALLASSSMVSAPTD